MEKIYANELHKPAIRKFERRQVFTANADDIWSADLMDVSNLATKNKKVNWLLVVIDIFSRYVWVIPLKNKNAKSVLNGFKSIGSTSRNLWTDEGSEFFNKDFKLFCEEKNINLYHTYSGLKAVYAERFNRTLRNLIFSYMTEHNTKVYITHLDEIVNEYNHTIHSGISDTPHCLYQ